MDFDKFSQSIVNGKGSALQMAKTLLSTPTLIYTGQYEKGNFQLPFAVPLEVETHQQTISAEVSESLVIASTKKVQVADNVAPGSWTWELSGYIPGMAALEPTNHFTPFVTLNTMLLKKAATSGYVMIFKDIDAHIYKRVVIKSLSVSKQPDCANKRPFRMTLKEINVMENTLASETEAGASALSQIGSALGGPLAMGSTAVTLGVGALSAASN